MFVSWLLVIVPALPRMLGETGICILFLGVWLLIIVFPFYPFSIFPYLHRGFLILSLISFFLILGCAPKRGALLPSEEVVSPVRSKTPKASASPLARTSNGARGKVITRAEFAHLLATRLDWNSIEKRPKKVIIIDISKSPYRNEIKKMARLGIMEVYPNHTFLPDKTLNRGECAKIVENILVTVKDKEKWRKKYLTKPSPFPDVPNYHRHFNAIMLATKKDVMKPYRDGTFKPGLPLSRGEARRVVRRMERYFK